MNKRIFTGNYYECKAGNLISISGDRGKSAGFTGKSIPKLAPKRAFWDVWHSNIERISEKENNTYYIREYYRQVLAKVNIEKLLEAEEDPILLCYERGNEFCHRHILAEYIEMKYGIIVRDIKIDKDFKVVENKRPEYIKRILEDIMNDLEV